MKFSMLHPADKLVMIMSRLYRYGMTTTSGGNISIKDSDGSVWITPAGVDKGSLVREDVVHILANGEIEGRHKPSSEYPFHLAVYRIRPDISAVLHAHPPALVALSVVRKIPDTSLVPDARFICGKVAMATYAVPGSELLGNNIAEHFSKGYNTVMLENHGVVIGAEDLFTAFDRFESLDHCAQVEINARTLAGKKYSGITDSQAELRRTALDADFEDFDFGAPTSEELEARQKLCKMLRRGYDNRLFISTQGVFSARLSDGSVIVTPYGSDRTCLEPEDLVKVSGNKKEKGKFPSPFTLLHEKIYANTPGFSSIITAQPPCIMAFAVCGKNFSTHTIPESYLMLRNVKTYPFGITFEEPDTLAQELSAANPACVIDKDCVIVCGNSPLQAFDRLEVMEYSAKSIIEAAAIGEDIVTIEGQDIEDIRVAFNLE